MRIRSWRIFSFMGIMRRLWNDLLRIWICFWIIIGGRSDCSIVWFVSISLIMHTVNLYYLNFIEGIVELKRIQESKWKSRIPMIMKVLKNWRESYLESVQYHADSQNKNSEKFKKMRRNLIRKKKWKDKWK